jgi:hypothetical protein
MFIPYRHLNRIYRSVYNIRLYIIISKGNRTASKQISEYRLYQQQIHLLDPDTHSSVSIFS